jgi:hypothetical protein
MILMLVHMYTAEITKVRKRQYLQLDVSLFQEECAVLESTPTPKSAFIKKVQSRLFVTFN